MKTFKIFGKEPAVQLFYSLSNEDRLSFMKHVKHVIRTLKKYKLLYSCDQHITEMSIDDRYYKLEFEIRFKKVLYMKTFQEIDLDTYLDSLSECLKEEDS